MAYLQGGPVNAPVNAGAVAPDSGGPVEAGAANSSPPIADRPLRLPGWQLVFAGQSRRWNQGGVCSVVPAAAEVLARAWLITVGQLADVWAQENSGVAVDYSATMAAVRDRVSRDAESGSYRRLAALGGLDGIAMMTITGTPEAMSHLNVPDPGYWAIVAAGLAETWGFTGPEIDAYLAGCPGARPT